MIVGPTSGPFAYVEGLGLLRTRVLDRVDVKEVGGHGWRLKDLTSGVIRVGTASHAPLGSVIWFSPISGDWLPPVP